MFRRTLALLSLPLLLLATALAAIIFTAPSAAGNSNFINDYSVYQYTAITLTLISILALAAGGTALAVTAKRRESALAALLAAKTKTHRVDNFVDFQNLLKDIIVENDDYVRSIAQMNTETEQLRTELSIAQSQTQTARRHGEAARCQSLQSASGTLHTAITNIHGAAGELQTATMSASSGARDQQRLSSESASAMEQMNASVAQVAESAEAAAVAADRAMEEAQAGASAVDETVAAIQAVNEHTAELSEVVSGLGVQAEGIGRIMNVIADIADQTNLLALNAAIEAARAGDAGRGFAVVADEVRKLAEKTMEATRDVGQQVEAIQGGVDRTRTGMTAAAAIVEQATEVARRSGTMLTTIVELAAENADQIRSIATAATQQSAASEQVTRAVAQVDNISQQTNEGMETSSQALENLLSGVSELDGLNGAFDLMGTGKVQQALNQLAESADILSMTPERQETAMRQTIAQSAFLELLYLTDAKGIQPCSNIPRPGQESPHDARAKGKDWSSRPWFTTAMETGTMVISEVYVSQASGERCITVSTPFGDQDKPSGVIAADVTLG
ncbi:methyl-accepting chemotaxis protein [Desulfovibrio ferrophilus]|uniref:Chemotaxis sensory transducer n=1 Tax=Desulfovibrio ferrophilus TaxID=241368 RepID=A0A2Z6AZG2_9BACT|nr:methyl-accepting chemotaxis protein [Desulfovibrio ferrophilus]BBD08608.1 chemotaxis sensory transducer [Desulfovibrio ferrophilus]